MIATTLGEGGGDSASDLGNPQLRKQKRQRHDKGETMSKARPGYQKKKCVLYWLTGKDAAAQGGKKMTVWSIRKHECLTDSAEAEGSRGRAEGMGGCKRPGGQ